MSEFARSILTALTHIQVCATAFRNCLPTITGARAARGWRTTQADLRPPILLALNSFNPPPPSFTCGVSLSNQDQSLVSDDLKAVDAEFSNLNYLYYPNQLGINLVTNGPDEGKAVATPPSQTSSRSEQLTSRPACAPVRRALRILASVFIHR